MPPDLPDLDDVLRRVAAGALSPDEALALLDEGAPAGPAAPPASPAPASPESDGGRFFGSVPDAGGSARAGEVVQDRFDPFDRPPLVHLRTSYRKIHVLADPTVAEVFVTGAHTVRRAGGALVIENPGDPAEEREGEAGARYRFTSLPRGLARPGSWKDAPLVVRVHPDTSVDAELSGGHLRVSGLWGGVRLRVAATAVRFEHVRGVFDIDALSSSVKGTVGPTGASTIDLESSSCKVQLLPGCDLRIQSRNRMGKVVLPTSVSKGGVGDAARSEATVGSGRDSLVIDALMSSVSVTP